MKSIRFNIKTTLSLAVIAAVLFISGCGTSGTQTEAPVLNGSIATQPSTATSAQQDTTEGNSSRTNVPAASKPDSGTVVQAAPGNEPLRLTAMNFINAKQGWTVAETKNGSYIWITEDGGATWRSSSIEGVFVRGIGFANGSDGWAAGKSGCHEEQGQMKCSQLQISHSKDGGTTWSMQWEQKQQQGQEVNLYNEDKIFAVNERQAYAIIGYSMLGTTDGGGHWNPVNFHIGPFMPEKASFSADGKSGWVLGRAGKGCKPMEQVARDQCAIAIVHTADAGAHWSLQWSPQDSTDLVTVGISFINPSDGWMMILSNDTLQSSLYGTNDAGVHWSKISEMRGGRPYTRGLQFVSDTTGFVPLSAGAGPIGGGLAVTRDGGKQFERKVEEGQEWSLEELHFFNEKLGWVRVSDPLKGDYLMITADGGNNWSTKMPHT